VVGKVDLLPLEKLIIRKKARQPFHFFVEFYYLNFGGIYDFSIGVQGLSVEAIGFGPLPKDLQEIGDLSGIKFYDAEFFPGAEFLQKSRIGTSGFIDDDKFPDGDSVFSGSAGSV